jgi:hypothetical protein
MNAPKSNQVFQISKMNIDSKFATVQNAEATQLACSAPIVLTEFKQSVEEAKVLPVESTEPAQAQLHTETSITKESNQTVDGGLSLPSVSQVDGLNDAINDSEFGQADKSVSLQTQKSFIVDNLNLRKTNEQNLWYDVTLTKNLKHLVTDYILTNSLEVSFFFKYHNLN